VYVSNYDFGTVSVLDTATLTATSAIAVGSNPDSVAITPGGKSLDVAHDVTGSGSVSVIDLGTNAVTDSVATGGVTPSALAVTTDGVRLLVVNKFSNNVAVLSIATHTVIGTVAVGAVPFGVAVSPDGGRAYMTGSGTDSLSVVDLTTLSTVATVPVGARPIGVALTPDGANAYVTNFGSGTVSTVSTASLTVTGTIDAGTQRVGIAIHAVPPAATTLVAGSATLTVRILGFAVKGLNAKPTEQHTGAPVAGQRVVFTTARGPALCGATTDDGGMAGCDTNVPLLVGMDTLLQGYTAGYPSNVARYQASTAHGAINLL
jgi:YVTN family beta-propeller protein